jgi:GT2 family glycosyltransferase
LLFVDADDEVGPGYLRAMSAALEVHDFVAARLDCSALNRGWVAEARSPAQCHGLGEGLFPYAYRCSIGVWRSSFEIVGGYDEVFDAGEDIDFCYRMALAGSTLAFVPDAVINYRFRTTLLGIWRQAYSYGIGAARILRRYRHIEDTSANGLTGLRWWGGPFRLLITARSKAALARGLYLTANRLGQLRGRFIRGRVC